MDAAQRQEIGTTVKATRQARGWLQEDLAKAAGLTVNTVRAIEQGKSTRADSLGAVLRALDIEPQIGVIQGSAWPPDVETTRDFIALYLMALPIEERITVARDIVQYLMSRNHPNG